MTQSKIKGQIRWPCGGSKSGILTSYGPLVEDLLRPTDDDIKNQAKAQIKK